MTLLSAARRKPLPAIWLYDSVHFWVFGGRGGSRPPPNTESPKRKHAWRWRLSVVGVLCCFYSTCHVEGETIDPTPWINASEMKLFRNKIRVSDCPIHETHTRSSSCLQILQTAFLHSETAWSQISSHIMLSCTWCLLNYLLFDDFSFCFKKRKLNK